MAFTVKDFEDLLRILDRYPHWREELRRRILLEELEQLPRAHRRLSVRIGRIEKALAALAETVRKLAQDQRRHAAALAKVRKEVAEARAEADRRFAELAETQRRTEESLAAYRAETERRFAELAEAQRRHYEEFAAHRQEFLAYRAETERRFAELAEAQRRTEESLAAYRAETERRFAELAEAQRRHYEEFAAHRQEFLAYRAETERRFAELAEVLRRLVERVDRIEQDVGTLKDHDLRRRYAELAPSYFGGPNFRKVRVLTSSELVNRLLAALDEGKIEREDFEEARRIDLVVRGEWEGRTLHLALETSWTIDRRDVERAVQRARILQAVLGETWPAVAGSRLTEGARELLQRIREEGRPIVVAQDGGIEWPS
ncbi:coiled-coil domain-containing protein [Thermoflexus hugenholtzii]|uniref:Uncharacterized protein n=2 Tax=Thermoflexus hugenholtzii JAD2 TaxID=877466 RepID=A0A212RRU7_9CHLR|nr:hypothetical protein [Thermoflexus hugenholtzii]SNB75179.1 hypothetical protein SAMN02746019_00018710 [Thermoflexus hugenholtzii JAD2]